jgi:quercetin dioxygenase-like cupin family protein
MMNTDQLWFTNVLMNVRLSNRDNAAGLSLLENVMAHGFSPPLHVHHHENETFYMLEGTVRFEMDGKPIIAGPGDVVHVPAGAVHSFVVLSPDGARFLTITDGGFEDMVREVSRPAANDGLPEQTVPTPAQQQMLAAACSRNGLELLGAPLAA